MKCYDEYVAILKEELVPAMGCTEPIAVAYAAAVARKWLGERPVKVDIRVSGNIIKNVKSVVVPNTDGMRGMEAAAAAGIIAGDETKELEVISVVTSEQIEEIKEFLKTSEVTVEESDSGYIFDIIIELQGESTSAKCRIAGFHTNIIYIERNGVVELDSPYTEAAESHKTDRSLLNVGDIVEFAQIVDLKDVRETISRQIDYNMTIAHAGMEGAFGARIGQILLDSYGNTVSNRAKAYAAAGSDARMNGCNLPVVINSGSGNQGITTSVPVIVYAEELQVSEETMYRALVLANLITIHLKTGIGRLSAYCGAISAGCGAAAGIAYLMGGRKKEIEHTIVNAVAINSGVICDGAKSSCAAKIASAVEAGLLGMQMYFHGSQFYGGDGIVTKGVENTIQNVGRLARQGMALTDKEIIDMMVAGTGRSC